jgi:hypothetical protein
MPEPSNLQQDKLSSIYIQQYNIEHLTEYFGLKCTTEFGAKCTTDSGAKCTTFLGVIFSGKGVLAGCGSIVKR